jgi:hypothetical protein
MIIIYELINGSFLWDSDESDFIEIDEQLTAMRLGWMK